MTARQLPSRTLLFLLVATACADEPALLASARRALAESVPQIAIQKLQTLLAGGALPAAARPEALELLATAQLAAGLHDDALKTIAPLVATHPAARLVQANALAAAGRWSAALPKFQAASREPDASPRARLGAAESLQALGRTAEAVKVLEEVVRQTPENIPAKLRLAGLYVERRKLKPARALLDRLTPSTPEDEKRKQYVTGRLLLAEGSAAPALELFEAIIADPQHLSDSLLAATTLAAGEARAILRDYDSADKPLVTFIWRYPESAWLKVVFQRLDEIYARQKNPGETELQKWAIKPPDPRAALAHYYLARMQMRAGKPERAAWPIAAFVEKYPTDPLLPFVHLMHAELLFEKRDLAGAVRALDAAERAAHDEAQRGEIELRRGLVFFAQREFLLAANEFHRAAERAPKLRETATFNAALADLQQENYPHFLTEYGTLTTHSPESPLRDDLIIEEGLAQARQSDPGAEATLQLFLSQFPFSTRQSEARLALAELAFQKGNPQDAARYLQVANTAPAEPAAAEHAEYLGVYLAEADPAAGPDKVIERAAAFIREHPKSPLLPEVRMKLGQVHFQSGNFAGAETQFTTLAQEAPASSYAETALFLAGQSAMQFVSADSIGRALKLFDDVVKRDGPLKLYARQQQAIVQAKLGKENEAVILYDAILAAQPPPELELRYAALAGKAENLLVLGAGRKDGTQLAAALAVFEQLASLPELPPAWRNQALYKKASVLELLGRSAEALAALNEVLEQDRSAPREYFWYYQAGFDLADRFERQANWSSAIAIYEKMSLLEGPRAADARARAKALRLKYFIWE